MYYFLKPIGAEDNDTIILIADVSQLFTLYETCFPALKNELKVLEPVGNLDVTEVAKELTGCSTHLFIVLGCVVKVYLSNFAT